MDTRKLDRRAVLRESRLMLSESPRLRPDPRKSRLREQISSPVTTEDWLWGRLFIQGTEEDYFSRRLSDNWTKKDVLPATYLETHNQVHEAYNAKGYPYNAKAKKPTLKLKSFDCSITLNIVFVKVLLSANWER